MYEIQALRRPEEQFLLADDVTRKENLRSGSGQQLLAVTLLSESSAKFHSVGAKLVA